MTEETPYWPDDPMLAKRSHGLQLEHVEGTARYRAACSCGVWTSPGEWDGYAQQEAFDEHMRQVQWAIRKVHGITDS
ncbi:hypothetical protein AB0I28_32540 [Phytomonospora sp. NPDC050363]|uniref:hypothetical protein n=1 Tax=Phytomonospora sp. NPDC050363 TaxID=3155642 RepID=UPI0033C1A187